MSSPNIMQYRFIIVYKIIQRAVEYYDSLKDNIASYFLYKIQDTLATKKSLKLLIEQNRQSVRRTSYIDGSSGDKQNENENGENEAANKMFDSGVKKRGIDEQSDESMDEEDDKVVDTQELKRKKYLKSRQVIMSKPC